MTSLDDRAERGDDRPVPEAAPSAAAPAPAAIDGDPTPTGPVETDVVGDPTKGAASTRRRLLLAVVAVSVLTAAGGFIAGSRLRSSDEIAAQTAAPEASLITVPVERRVISSIVVVRGDVRFEESTEISVTVSSEVNAVITRPPPAVDEIVDEGSLLAEIGGRPVFLLGGDLPNFREMRPGQNGDDVKQLQEALARLGHFSGTVDGAYGPTTEAAVEAFYVAEGYVAPGPTQDELDRLRTARESVADAKDNQRATEQALGETQTTVARSTRLQLDAEVADSESGLNEARTTATASVATAEAEARAAVAARDAAAAALPVARQQVAAAQAALDAALATLDPETSLPPSEEEVAPLRDALAVAVANATQLEADLAAAEAVVVTSNAAIATARTTGADQVRNAETRLAIARASRDEALAPQSASSAQQAVDEARASVTRAEEDLAKLDSETGTVMPQSELVFLTNLPRRVESSSLERGDAVQGAIMSVSGADLIIDSGVSAADRPLLSEGAEVRIEDEGLGIDAAGQIVFLATSPGTGSVGASRYEMRIRATEALPSEARGLNLRITIPVSSTGGEVLAVPLAALSASADGTARVEVAESDGTTRAVQVRVGLSAGGFAEIEPLDGQLEEGDRVVVGTDRPAGPAGSGPDDAPVEDAPAGDEPAGDQPVEPVTDEPATTSAT